jgi:hypothetical protein
MARSTPRSASAVPTFPAHADLPLRSKLRHILNDDRTTYQVDGALFRLRDVAYENINNPEINADHRRVWLMTCVHLRSPKDAF